MTAGSRQPLLLLAVDGLDWPLLRRMAAGGELPAVGALLAAGVQADVALPPPHNAAAHWVSLATGAAADAHGVLGDRRPTADGLFTAAPAAADVRCETLWQSAWSAGLTACVAGWPATAGSVMPAAAGPGSMAVAAGAETPGPQVTAVWPLAPDAVAPATRRTRVHAMRMHPFDVRPEMLHALLGGLPAEVIEAAEAQACQLLAAWTSIHNLGVHWVAEVRPQLLALRLAGLPAWCELLRDLGVEGPPSLAPWLRYLDLLIGRYRDLLGPLASWALVTAEPAGEQGQVLLAGPAAAGLPGGRLDVLALHRRLLGLLSTAR